MDKSEVKENAGTSYDMASRVIKRISQMFQSFAGHLTPFKEQQPPLPSRFQDQRAVHGKVNLAT